MRLVDRAAAMLEVLTAADIEALPLAERRRFAAHCRRAADLAEPRPETPKAGVLVELRDGRQT